LLIYSFSPCPFFLHQELTARKVAEKRLRDEKDEEVAQLQGELKRIRVDLETRLRVKDQQLQEQNKTLTELCQVRFSLFCFII
jgi:nitrate/nitrite-specific signal transduction histidine kinase